MAEPQQKSEGEKLILKKGGEKSTRRQRKTGGERNTMEVCVDERQGEGGSLSLQEGERDREGEPDIETKGKRCVCVAGRVPISPKRLLI